MKIEEIVSDKGVVELLHKDGIVEATKVQEKSIPLIMDGKDVVVQSETGSGKTFAFVLPIIENISGDKIEALVIAPTRELAKQITYVFKRYSRFNAVSIYGGVSITNQIKNLRTANIIAGTPGRLLDLLDRGELHIDEIKYLVLDEADRMLDMGFIDDIEKIMKRTNENRQTLLFSATIPKEVIDMSNKYMVEPAKVMIEGVVTTAKLCHKFYVVSFKEKFSLLVHLLQTKEANLSLIFCATKKMADNLARELQRYDIRAKAIHGDLSQNQREQVLHDFRRKRIDVLVATDVAARGLDIDDITHIYNFDLPNEILMYTHRAGRTARMGNEGEVISLVSEKDYLLFGKIKKTENIEEMKKPNFRRLFFKMEKGGMKHNGYRKKTKYHGRGRRY